MTNNFTDRNKAIHKKEFSPEGGRIIDMSEQNGYGDAFSDFARGAGTYNPQAQSAQPINYSGMENFSDNDRFTGDMGGQTRVQASAPGEKDSIETMGKSDEKVAREM